MDVRQKSKLPIKRMPENNRQNISLWLIDLFASVVRINDSRLIADYFVEQTEVIYIGRTASLVPQA